jgi:hypothetical protein
LLARVLGPQGQLDPLAHKVLKEFKAPKDFQVQFRDQQAQQVP